ncbi:hypothetical protein NHX12_005447 [Muraenolepis orangiensis]|uniref:Uncharacterized protein n=1 Tax=Muraenolepis orangiensis TaxID=630683 RepID=A0A9Q0ICB1_9TELE|nr:hypothetical protein NHX12_005447 [Muraenolepis orangiensis]
MDQLEDTGMEQSRHQQLEKVSPPTGGLPPSVHHPIPELEVGPMRVVHLHLRARGRHLWPCWSMTLLQPASHSPQCAICSLVLSQLLTGQRQPPFITAGMHSCHHALALLLLPLTVPALHRCTRTPGESISVAMLTARPVLHLKVVLLQSLQPPGHLVLWVPETQEPGEETSGDLWIG